MGFSDPASSNWWEPKTPKREPKTPWEPDTPLWEPKTPSWELKTPFREKKHHGNQKHHSGNWIHPTPGCHLAEQDHASFAAALALEYTYVDHIHADARNDR